MAMITTRIRRRSQPTHNAVSMPRNWIQVLVGLLLVQSSAATPHHMLRRRDQQILPRVIGGSPVKKGDHPYFAFWAGPSCGGVVIHDDLVLSAAHCYDPSASNSPSRWLYLNSTIRNRGMRVRYTSEEVHPLYNATEGPDYDFILLKTSTSMLRTGNGKPTGVEKIKVNRNPLIPEDDEPVLAVGYGQTDAIEAAQSDILKDVLLYYYPNEFCANQYHTAPGKFQKEAMFCTGVPGGGKDTCKVS